MRDFLIYVDPREPTPLQAQIRRRIVDAVLTGQLRGDDAIPSARDLARKLGVARNTVTLAYQRLVEDGYLVSRQRSGFYVAPATARVGTAFVGKRDQRPRSRPIDSAEWPDAGIDVDWSGRLTVEPSRQANIAKPAGWRRFPYPFLYGQVDPDLFPISAWRDCSRQALARASIGDWTLDHFERDDDMLLEQLRARVLPRRGLAASAEELLVTLGAQHALFIVARLLCRAGTVVGVEEPGYPDARNIFRLQGATLRPLPVDEHGLVVGDHLAGLDCLYVTPSHQHPTTVTMPLERRMDLLALARRHDFIVIEDDYEAEANFLGHPSPALKSLDRDGRVVYVGSLSKVLAPGLRIGHLVAAPRFIAEARALRRLMIRHPPTNNERAAALFIAEGYFNTLLGRIETVYHERWEAMAAALDQHLPGVRRSTTRGGSCFWLEGPPRLDSVALAAAALDRGVLIEPADILFMAEPAPRHFFRLGFSSIDTRRIAPGIERLAEAFVEVMG